MWSGSYHPALMRGAPLPRSLSSSEKVKSLWSGSYHPALMRRPSTKITFKWKVIVTAVTLMCTRAIRAWRVERTVHPLGRSSLGKYAWTVYVYMIVYVMYHMFRDESGNVSIFIYNNLKGPMNSNPYSVKKNICLSLLKLQHFCCKICS